MAELAPTHQEVEEGLPPKRPRLSEQRQHQQEQQQQHDSHGHRQDGRGDGEEEGEGGTGCVYSNAGFPWNFRSRRASSSALGSTNGPLPPPPQPPPHVEPKEGDEGGRLPPRQLFDGPLLSVREYRDQPTGDVRFAVFHGDRRMSVAQILFSLKRGENDHAYGHVKSVKVHRDFRGMGLGPLLFKEVFATLGNLLVTEVRLEAEEDMCKYNRLVRYYEDLGFRQLEGSKVHYLHHCDQVYRRIPMLRPVSMPAQPRFRPLPRLVDNGGWFLVVRLQTKTGSFVRSTASGDGVSPSAGAGGAATAAVAGGGPGDCASVTNTAAAGSGLDPDGGGGCGGGGGCEVDGCYGGNGGALAGGGTAAVGCSAGGGGGAAGGGAEGRWGNGATAAGNGYPSRPGGGGGGGRVRKGGQEAGESAERATGTRRRGRGGEADDLWTLTVSEVRGVVCFESAYGKYLCVEPDGKVVADRPWDDSWEQFSLERFTPDLPPASPAHPHGTDCTSSTADEKRPQEHVQDTCSHGAFSSPETAGPASAPPCGGFEATAGGGSGGDAREGDGECGAAKERRGAGVPGSSGGITGRRAAVGGRMPTTRFALRTYHGQYLSLDAEFGTVSTSAQPVLWSTDEKNSICQCEGEVPWAAPPPASRRQVALQAHLRSMRQIQNVSFVTGTRKKYMGSFGRRGRFSVKDALDLLDRHHDPLQSTRVSHLSFAGLLVLTAQDIRDGGLPDWMQAIGLIHGLGRVLHFLGEDAGVTETERECVLGEYSWVVGAPFPDSITCASYNVENEDALDERYGAGGTRPTGMYDKASGLENAMLCFTGPEYMFMVLRNHGTTIPPQGLAMLRLYPLEPWHSGGCYSDLESAADRDTKNAVQQFDAIRRATLHSINEQRREVNLERAWYEHLKDLVDKFFPGDLAW